MIKSKILFLMVEGHGHQAPEDVKGIDGAMVNIGAAACSLVPGLSTASKVF